MGLSYAVLDVEYSSASGDLTEASLKFLDSVSEVAQPVIYSYPVISRDLDDRPIFDIDGVL